MHATFDFDFDFDFDLDLDLDLDPDLRRTLSALRARCAYARVRRGRGIAIDGGVTITMQPLPKVLRVDELRRRVRERVSKFPP